MSFGKKTFFEIFYFLPMAIGILFILFGITGPAIYWIDIVKHVYSRYVIAGTMLILIPMGLILFAEGKRSKKMNWPFIIRKPLEDMRDSGEDTDQEKSSNSVDQSKIIGDVEEKSKAEKYRKSMLFLGITTLLGSFLIIYALIIDYPSLREDFGVILTPVYLLFILLTIVLEFVIVFNGLRYVANKPTMLEKLSKNYSNALKSTIKQSLPKERKLSTFKKYLNRPVLISFFIILLLSGTLWGYEGSTQPSRCYFTAGTFNTAAYSLPSGTHINTDLDNTTLINQTQLAALEKSLWSFTQLQRGGGFPLKSEVDGSFMYADRGTGCPLFPLEFSIQSGTGMVGDVYLGMYQLEPNQVYLDVAKAVGDALVAVQDEVGGFYYEGRRNDDGSGMLPHPANYRQSAILDDDVMQSAMRFLLNLYNTTEDPKYKTAIDKGFDLLFSIEIEGGGWPQRTNFEPDEYQSYVTLNDDSMYDVIMLMLQGYNQLGEQRFLDAAIRAADFLVRVQGNGGSVLQQAWAQQYKDDQPAWARAFEPYAMCSKQTGSAIQMLMELYLYTNNASYLEPIPAAVNWLLSNETIIPLTDYPGQYGWSRLYELETNIPIVGNRNNRGNGVEYYYEYDPVRDYGYSWQGTFGINATLANWYQLLAFSNNSEDYLSWRTTNEIAGMNHEPISETSILTDEGFWISSDNYITASDFSGKAWKFIKYFQFQLM